jgi:hypothetical protein
MTDLVVELQQQWRTWPTTALGQVAEHIVESGHLLQQLRGVPATDPARARDIVTSCSARMWAWTTQPTPIGQLSTLDNLATSLINARTLTMPALIDASRDSFIIMILISPEL